jgi:hypothetical protein
VVVAVRPETVPVFQSAVHSRERTPAGALGRRLPQREW